MEEGLGGDGLVGQLVCQGVGPGGVKTELDACEIERYAGRAGRGGESSYEVKARLIDILTGFREVVEARARFSLVMGISKEAEEFVQHSPGVVRQVVSEMFGRLAA